MVVYWYCLDCDQHGETSGTESGADVKHAQANKHGTSTTTRKVSVSFPQED